jgi:hypothetical protein
MSQSLEPTSPDQQAADERAPDEAVMSPLQLAIAGVVGVASAGSGAVAVFKTENEVGSAALITVGVYFIVAVIIRRFPRFKLGDNEIDPTARRLAAQADRRARLAAEDAADAKEGLQASTAESELHPPGKREAPVQSVDPEIVQLADEYNRVRWTMPSGTARTRQMTDIVERMVSRFRELGPADFENLLRSEDRGLRLAGIAAVYAHPTADAIPTLVDASVTPDKPFNEYWALRALGRVAEGNCDQVTAEHRRRLKARLDSFPPGADRADEIRRVLKTCP